MPPVNHHAAPEPPTTGPGEEVPYSDLHAFHEITAADCALVTAGEQAGMAEEIPSLLTALSHAVLAGVYRAEANAGPFDTYTSVIRDVLADICGAVDSLAEDAGTVAMVMRANMGWLARRRYRRLLREEIARAPVAQNAHDGRD